MASRHFNCPSRSKEISIDSNTCPNCGAIMDDGATRRFDPRITPTRSYDSIDNARFRKPVVPGDRVRRAMAAIEVSDAMLVVGSSLMIYSGYRFATAAADAGKPIAAINLGRTRADDILTLKISDRCANALRVITAPWPISNTSRLVSNPSA